jgi:hypothetical protein
MWMLESDHYGGGAIASDVRGREPMKFELMKPITAGATIIAVGLMAACAGQTNPGATRGAQEKIFETNVTNDLTLSSGEPEIAIDPKNPHHIAIVEFALGSAKIPAYSRNVLGDLNMDPPTKREATGNSGRVMLSTDGGNTWTPHPPPVFGPGPLAARGGDPMIAYGPDGTLYVGDEPFPEDPAKWSNFSLYGQVYTASTDDGKTFGPPKSSDGPMDRPWLVVDQSNGAVYTVSSGQYNAKTNEHNVPGPDAPMDRWLVAWQPHLAGKSEPRRIGGPDFSASGGSTLAAAHGVVAATFVLGGAQPGLGFTGARPEPTPVPASLQSIVQSGVTSCSMQAPCLFFETSSDQGLHWSRHQVVVPGGFNAQRANVSADPTTPGRYAIAVMSAARTNFLVLTTKDSGATWSGPVAVAEAAPGVDFKQWMAFGPSGVIGLMWW